MFQSLVHRPLWPQENRSLHEAEDPVQPFMHLLQFPKSNCEMEIETPPPPPEKAFSTIWQTFFSACKPAAAAALDKLLLRQEAECIWETQEMQDHLKKVTNSETAVDFAQNAATRLTIEEYNLRFKAIIAELRRWRLFGFTS